MKAFLVLLALFCTFACVTSEQLEKIDYVSVGGATRIVKRHNTPDTRKCLCSQALANFGDDCTDPSCLVGSIQFSQNPCGQSTFTGLFLSGFSDTSADYKFTLSKAANGKKKHKDDIDLTRFINLRFFKGGLKTFTATTKDFSLNCGELNGRPGAPGVGPSVAGRTLFIRSHNEVIGRALVRGRR